MKCFDLRWFGVFGGLLFSLAMPQQVNAGESEVSLRSAVNTNTDNLTITYQSQSAPKLFTAPRYVLLALEGFGDNELPNLSADGIEFIRTDNNLLVLIARREVLSWAYRAVGSGSVQVQVQLNPAQFANQQFSGISLQLSDQFRSMTFEEVESSEMQRVVMGALPVDRLLVMLSDYGDYMQELKGLVERGDITEEVAMKRAEKARVQLLKERAALRQKR